MTAPRYTPVTIGLKTGIARGHHDSVILVPTVIERGEI